MLTKIKSFSIISVLILSLQTTIFAMDLNEIIDFNQNWYKKRIELVLLYKKINQLPRNYVPKMDSPKIIASDIVLDEPTTIKTYLSMHYACLIVQSTLVTDTIKKDVMKKIKTLHTKNSCQELITDEDVLEITTLWNQFKSLHNYNWIDRIIYPFHKTIDPEQVTKERNRKPLNLLLHSDRYREENKKQMDALFICLGDASRVVKSMDFIIDPIIAIATSTAARATFQAVTTACSLPSMLFPDYFTNKNTSHYKNALNKTNKDIKIVELNIQAKQQEARDAVIFFSTKNKNVRTN
jgi:hypothetical protein